MTRANGGPKPLIGLSGRRRWGRDLARFPESLGHLAMDVYLADYSTCVLAAGGLPVHLSMDADPLEYVPYLNGIVLTGGCDVEPKHYGEEPDGNGDYEPERDELELELLTRGLEHEVPVLGICRGLQVINVHAGGTLQQHVPEHARYDIPPETRSHNVVFEQPSRLALLYQGRPGENGGDDRVVAVNSLHHQIVDEVGDGFVVTARDETGVVEGIELPGHDVLAIQWHPEMLTEPEPVFDWLVQQARKRIPG